LHFAPELREQIKARFPALPVIVVSGKPFIDKLRIGAVTEFFPKPYDLSKLTAHIATLVPPNKAGPEKLKHASDDDNAPSDTPDTVLVVEGDVMARLGLAEYLRHCGYRVIEAASGAEAITLLSATPKIDIAVVLSAVG
jgi:DNA-binding NtrC family response regulator